MCPRSDSECPGTSQTTAFFCQGSDVWNHFWRTYRYRGTSAFWEWSGSCSSGFWFGRFLSGKDFSLYFSVSPEKSDSLPVAAWVPEKRFPRFRFRFRFLENASNNSGFRVPVGSCGNLSGPKRGPAERGHIKKRQKSSKSVKIIFFNIVGVVGNVKNRQKVSKADLTNRLSTNFRTAPILRPHLRGSENPPCLAKPRIHLRAAPRVSSLCLQALQLPPTSSFFSNLDEIHQSRKCATNSLRIGISGGLFGRGA